MRHADKPEIVEELHVDAPPERVWPIISDIALPVGPSPELQGATWLDDGDGPAVGRRFVGTNRNEHFGEWQTTCTLVECDPPTTFGWVVGDPDEPNSSWRFTVEPDGAGGSTVRQWARLGTGESGMTTVIARMPDKEERIVQRRLDDWRTGLRANLVAIKAAAERA